MESFSLRNLSIDEAHALPDLPEQEYDPMSTYNRSPHVEPFHRQRRIDGTLSFSDQLLTMQHIVFTNALDGRPTMNDNLTAVDDYRGGVWKEVIHSGIGQRPSIGASVRLHYYAYFEHRDEPFDTSFKRRRVLEFRLGKCEVLPGIDLAVSTMQRRERAKFIISSDLLYGELGCAPHIPESTWCLYVVELLSTNEPSTIIHDEQLTVQTSDQQQVDDFAKRIRLAQILRNTGNEEYANGHLDRSLRSYNKARQLIHTRVTLIDGKTEEQYHQLLLKLHLNSAQCYRRLDNYERCLRACRDALIIEPNNLKALFRASVSLRLLNRLDEAGKYLSKASQIDPLNHDVQIEMSKLKEALDSANKHGDTPITPEESSKPDQLDAEALDQLLSSIDVSQEFREQIGFLLSESSVIDAAHYSETECFYIRIVAQRRQLTVRWKRE